MKKSILRIISVIFIFALIFSLFLVCSSALSKGDVDGDGIVSAADARLTLRASVGLENYKNTIYFDRADYDEDGIITATDARMILRTSVGLEKVISLDEVLSYKITNIINRIEDSEFSESGKEFNVIIEIINTGTIPIYLDNCILDYEDDDGHLLQTYDFVSTVPDVVSPGEKGYFYTNGGVDFDKDISFENGCNLVPSITVKKAKDELKSHKVEDVSIYEKYGRVGCRGRVVNETNEEISAIYLRAVYYDKDGKVLGISGTNVFNLAANKKTSFDNPGFSMSDFSLDDVAFYEIYADEWYFQF